MERLEKSIRGNDHNESIIMIRYVPHKNINKEQYDICISNAPNSIIYAFSWYLDTVSPGWDMLESDDYKTVMPLPHRKRLGLSYIFTPRYVQQLGVFGPDVNKSLIQAFLKQIPPKFRLIDLKFNEKNSVEKLSGWTKRTNYLLNINAEYEMVSKSYHRNCNRNIKKAQNAGLLIGKSLNAREFSEFIRENLQDQIEGFVDSDVILLEKITEESLRNQEGEIVCVRDPEGNISAAGSFLFSGDRLIFSVCASSSKGHKEQAMYYLVDQQIKKYSGKFTVFDFSGSEIKGIAYFNASFGAQAVSYPFLRINKLPMLLKLLVGKS